MGSYPRYDASSRPPVFDSIEAERSHRKRMCTLGYRIFGTLSYLQIGDGHISARDPKLAVEQGEPLATDARDAVGQMQLIDRCYEPARLPIRGLQL